MANDARPLVYGPAYLDLVVTIDRAFCTSQRVDKSIKVNAVTPNTAGAIRLRGENGDDLHFPLPVEFHEYAADCYLCETVLNNDELISDSYRVISVKCQLGGMGAGYALALHGLLRHPLGTDTRGEFVRDALQRNGVTALAEISPGTSDLSLVILGAEDKLTMGLRPRMTAWRATAEDIAHVSAASALCICGAPNALTAILLPHARNIPTMLAPSRRNIDDQVTPLADFAGAFSYLSLNRLEWEELPERQRWQRNTQVITITDGPHGCRVLLPTGDEFSLPALPHNGPADTNRCGETFAAAFFRTLLRESPTFHQHGVPPSLAMIAAEYALAQAAKQLDIFEFGMPKMG